MRENWGGRQWGKGSKLSELSEPRLSPGKGKREKRAVNTWFRHGTDPKEQGWAVGRPSCGLADRVPHPWQLAWICVLK